MSSGAKNSHFIYIGPFKRLSSGTYAMPLSTNISDYVLMINKIFQVVGFNTSNESESRAVICSPSFV